MAIRIDRRPPMRPAFSPRRETPPTEFRDRALVVSLPALVRRRTPDRRLPPLPAPPPGDACEVERMRGAKDPCLSSDRDGKETAQSSVPPVPDSLRGNCRALRGKPANRRDSELPGDDG